MMVCPKCKGNGSLCQGMEIQGAGAPFGQAPGSVTFTNPTQFPVMPCTTCLGAKYFNGSST